MKKFISFLSCALFVAAMTVACGGGSNENDEEENGTPAVDIKALQAQAEGFATEACECKGDSVQFQNVLAKMDEAFKGVADSIATPLKEMVNAKFVECTPEPEPVVEEQPAKKAAKKTTAKPAPSPTSKAAAKANATNDGIQQVNAPGTDIRRDNQVRESVKNQNINNTNTRKK